MNSLINGQFFTNLIDRLFHLIHLVIRAVDILFKIVKKILNELLFSRIDNLLSRMAKRSVANRTHVDNNSIVLAAMQGEFTCNPKYIAEELIRRKLPYDITWVLRGASLGPYPSEMKLIKDGSPEFYKAIAKAKVVIQNGHALQRQGVHKSKRQYWLQTWHGSLGLKRLEGAGGDENFYNAMKELDIKQTDYLISNSQFEDDVFNSTYWPGVKSLRLGHARNDILLDHSKKTANRLRTKALTRLDIKDTGQKFLLFAPTHDDTNLDQSFGNLDFESLREELHKKFGGTWDILIRTHNNNKRRSSRWLAGLPLYCHNASFYPDMQELLVVADAGLTDYSSWVCDYILTGKPSFLYGANIKKYNKTRGFYHDITDTPFTMATTNAELLKNIAAFDASQYKRKTDAFLKKCDAMDDGKAAARIVDEIEKLMSK